MWKRYIYIFLVSDRLVGYFKNKWLSHLPLSGWWIQILDLHHGSLTKASPASSLCPAWSFLFRGMNTHPWPARLNEPCSPHVPQKCHCVVSPGLFFLPRRRCDFYIRCHGDVARRKENESSNLWLQMAPRPDSSFGESRKQHSGCLFVCWQ